MGATHSSARHGLIGAGPQLVLLKKQPDRHTLPQSAVTP
jgi:hypothetical protein